ncbi:MAG: hypothetical protein NC908_01520 [Candidatus Omnitrophica bacterium]|nr:hypothetical protein [Candidatus Omnitrophota bacterium]
MNNIQKKNLSIILTYLLCIHLAGCVAIKQNVKGILGLSTKEIEQSRLTAISKTFLCNRNVCYDKTKEILKQIQAYIYVQNPDKTMIAIYVSENDTTPVGIFFKDVDTDITQVEVSSPSKYARDLIGRKLFSNLESSFSLASTNTDSEHLVPKLEKRIP